MPEFDQAADRLKGSWLARFWRIYLDSPFGADCTGRRIVVGPKPKRVAGMAEQLPVQHRGRRSELDRMRG
jgi:hypothetical protein